MDHMLNSARAKPLHRTRRVNDSLALHNEDHT